MYNKFLPVFKTRFHDVFDDFHLPAMNFHPSFSMKPRVNISETDKSYEITADLPGMKKEDVKLKLENNILTISGERKQEKEEKGKNWHRVESAYGAFERHIQLSDNVKEDTVSAVFKDGVLCITIEKKAKVEVKSNAKQITIK